MLHVFPEVDSKHSESEWNQDSEYGNYQCGMGCLGLWCLPPLSIIFQLNQ